MFLFMKLAVSSNAPRHPGGRPSSYRPEFCARIVDAMATGLSLDAAAAEIGISPRSAYQWQRDILEFSQAIEMGRAKALLLWEKRAIAVANGEGGDAQIISLALRNRSRSASGWHEAARLEHSGPDGAPLQMEARATVIDAKVLTAEQRQTMKELLLAIKSAAGR
jgi:hypothetical protein